MSALAVVHLVVLLRPSLGRGGRIFGSSDRHESRLRQGQRRLILCRVASVRTVASLAPPSLLLSSLCKNFPACRGQSQTGRVSSRSHEIACEVRPSKAMRLVAAGRYCPSEDWLHAMSRSLQVSLSIVSQDCTLCLQGRHVSGRALIGIPDQQWADSCSVTSPDIQA